MYYHSMMEYGWRGSGRFWEPEKYLSVLELVNSGTLDLKLAGLLWLIMEQRASVIVAALPSYAGKSTTLNVLMDFLKPDVEKIYLEGLWEDFGFLREAVPEKSYLVASEFNYYGGYVWGDVAVKAFQLLEQGYALGGTMHTRTAKEVIYLFYNYLGLPLNLLGRLDVIVNLRVTAGRTYASEPVRQIATVSVPVYTEDKMTLETIALRSPESNAFDTADYKKLQMLFSIKFGLPGVDIEREVQTRAGILSQLMSEGRISREEVRQAIVDFYDSRKD